ncbi:hypothetical protein FMK56_12650 [Klebsiella oxytoca]|nr:hypothetical protein [Klebsiella oxytoca]ELJ5741428.1 hypothetical protein [Klebsiella oxytoca]MBZ7165214.1 hypothetical protein [Klebsiella oxytoca]
MCNCMKDIGEKLHGKLMDKVPDGAEVNKGFDTGWENTWLNFSSGETCVMLKYKLAYRAKKKNGEMAKNLTRTECAISMTYCPFCGEKNND